MDRLRVRGPSSFTSLAMHPWVGAGRDELERALSEGHVVGNPIPAPRKLLLHVHDPQRVQRIQQRRPCTSQPPL